MQWPSKTAKNEAMKTLFLLSTILLSYPIAHAYYSKDSTEGTVTFTAKAEIDQLYKDSDIYANTIPPQLDYLAGSLQPDWDELFRNSTVAQKTASPKKDERVRILRRFQEGKKWFVEYQYTGTFVVGNKVGNTIALHLPFGLNPNEVLNETTSDSCFVLGAAYRNAYYWNPKRPGCNMVEGVDYITIQASISRIPNTTNTSPRYDSLSSNGEIRMILAFGAEEDSFGKLPPGTKAVVSDPHNPQSKFNRADYNAQGYLQTRDFLVSEGFSRPVSIAPSVRERECGTTFGEFGGFVEEFTRQDGNRKVVVRMFWGIADFGIAELSQASRAFYCTIKEGAERGSVLLYSGHSRVGLLTLEYVSQILQRPISAARDRYQIFGFLGCSGYGHYTLSYLNAKRSSSDPTGTLNADVITNGVFGNFDEMGSMNIKTISPLLQWSKTGAKASWQQIINSYNKSYLTGVNGDE